MPNRDVSAAWDYHEATKHSYMSVRTNAHYMDWDNQPLPFKIYTDELPVVPLPQDRPATDVPALAAIARTVRAGSDPDVPSLQDLAHVLFFAGGITKRKRYPGGEVLFRAASCTGALYEIDLYVLCQDLPDLAAGVYHFDPRELVLRRLRSGDYRGVLGQATAHEPAVVHAPATLVCTATYWRNAWKYQARTYRHFGWDNGTIVANALASTAALGLPACVLCGFVDDTVSELLALDTEREVAFSLLALGFIPAPPPAPPKVDHLSFQTVRLSPSEVDYPIMRELHEASSLGTAEEVSEWRAQRGTLERGTGSAERGTANQSAGLVPLRPHADEEMPHDSIETVIVRRGSTRRFDRRASMSFEELSTMLYRATQALPADFLGDGRTKVRRYDPRDDAAPLMNDLYLIVHSVDGLASGAYVMHRAPWTLELIKEGNFRGEAGYLGLQQDLPAEGCAVVFFLADLHAVLERHGNRGYRAVQLEAGILGGRLYLAAYAQRLGASGLTFFDDDVVEFFSPHARGKSTIFCVALGKSVRLVQTTPFV